MIYRCSMQHHVYLLKVLERKIMTGLSPVPFGPGCTPARALTRACPRIRVLLMRSTVFYSVGSHRSFALETRFGASPSILLQQHVHAIGTFSRELSATLHLSVQLSLVNPVPMIRSVTTVVNFFQPQLLEK